MARLRQKKISRKAKRAIIVKVAIVAVLAAVEVVKPHLFLQPYHTSMRTGQNWIDELLNGHHKRMQRNLGMPALNATAHQQHKRRANLIETCV